ncbi:MAG: Holliday junction branch migration protein RuvA, partial [Nostocaceae cyanobacterium]|nr:Holliday junction branch migration protein RuvA [Nostocaceae cyanobacterium]
MINYLKGIVTGIDKSTTNRVILTIEVNNLGYEVQVPARLLPQLSSGEVQI